MDVRPDWKNRPQDEGPRQFEKIETKDYEATIKAVDADRYTITIAVGGQEYTLRVAQDAFIEEPSFRSYAVPGHLKGVPAGGNALIVTNKKDDQDVVTRIKLRASN